MYSGNWSRRFGKRDLSDLEYTQYSRIEQAILYRNGASLNLGNKTSLELMTSKEVLAISIFFSHNVIDENELMSSGGEQPARLGI